MIVDKIKKRESKNIRPSNKVDIQVGKWVKCDKCKEIIYKENNNLPLFITSLIFTVILIVRHRPNLQRMLNGTENKIKWMG